MYFMCKDQDLVAAAINCEYKDLYTAWFGDAVIKRDLASNEYLNWEFMKMAKAAGFKRYENWGADMKRLNQFKSKFNPILVPYYHVRKKDRLGALSEWGYDNVLASPYLGFIKKAIF
jgi:lipid II:glycine glycyltransferase (peptidoglycan interpeptide bridge formation enzyme)